MAWLYVPGVEDSNSGSELPSKMPTGLSVTLNTKPMQQQTWRRALKMKPWMLLLSGMTLKPSILNRGVERWISSLAAIRASRSRPPVSAAVKKILGTYGRGSLTTSDASSQNLLFSRTSEDTYLWDSAKSTRSFSLWVTQLRQDSSQRRKLGLRIAESGSSSWPTARAEDAESCGNHPGATDSLTGAGKKWTTPCSDDTGARKAKYKQGGTPLSMQAQWPTPHGMAGVDKTGKPGAGGEFAKMATNWQSPCAGSNQKSKRAMLPSTNNGKRTGGGQSSPPGLEQQAQGMNNWPTPRISDTCGPGEHGQGGLDLRTAVAADSWPTPTTAEADKISNAPNYGQKGLSNHPAIVGTPDRDKGTKSRSGRPDHRPENRGPKSSSKRRRLNPLFVTWLMGWPLGWSSVQVSLDSSAMESYLSRQRGLLSRLLEL